MRSFKWVLIGLCLALVVPACKQGHETAGTKDAPSRWRVVLKRFDHNGDGKTDEIGRLSYDSAGRLVSYESDGELGVSLSPPQELARPDGKTDSVIRYVYDDIGRPVFKELDSNNDGKIEGAGNTSESVTHYAYDREGRLVREESDYFFKPHEKGTIDHVTHYTYDQTGRTAARRFDNNADGKVDAVEGYLYDEKGRHVKTLSDFNNDGEPDGICTFTYSGAGKKETKQCDGRKVSMYDSSPPDGTVDSTVRYFYDEEGRMTREEGDDDADGVVDWVYRYTYDESGNEVVLEFLRGKSLDLTFAERTEWERIPPGTPEPVDLMPPIPLPR